MASGSTERTVLRAHWDDARHGHLIAQVDGNEQGDSLMPVLFLLCQHAALAAAGEVITTFLDDR